MDEATSLTTEYKGDRQGGDKQAMDRMAANANVVRP